jgi:hypothetical protein
MGKLMELQLQFTTKNSGPVGTFILGVRARRSGE